MFNLGAGEVLVILLLALIVLGPTRLPDAAKQVGKFMSEIRKLSTGFQNELKTAFDDETEAAARRRGAAAVTEQPTVVPMPDPPGPPATGDAAQPGKTPAANVDAAPTPARPRRAQPLRAPAKRSR